MSPASDEPATRHGDLPPRQGVYRLGVFGSMMNPPHLGHRALVDAVHQGCRLDRVVVVPAGIPPHRAAPDVPSRTRLALTIRAFADLDHVVVSDTEVVRGEAGEPGFMVETVEELVAQPAELGYDLVVEPWLVVGADQAPTLSSWHRWPELAAMASVAMVTRPDQLDDADLHQLVESLREQGARVGLVEMAPVAISSTRVREAARSGDRSLVASMVPAAIVDDVVRFWGP